MIEPLLLGVNPRTVGRTVARCQIAFSRGAQRYKPKDASGVVCQNKGDSMPAMVAPSS